MLFLRDKKKRIKLIVNVVELYTNGDVIVFNLK
jgi:hypothetical protein